MFYSYVLSDLVLLVVFTLSKYKVIIRDQVIKNTIAKGTFSHIYEIIYARIKEAIVAKELQQIKYNLRKVDKEVIIAKYLINIKYIYKCL